MQYKTHLVSSYVLALPILAYTDQLSVPILTGIGIGALFPDVDEPRSFIGSRLRGISDFIKLLFGHRGMTHSLIGMIVTALFFYALHYTLAWDLSFVHGFILGYGLHLIGDSFSKSGIKWLLPFSTKPFQAGFNYMYYTTGSIVEHVLFLILTGVLIWQVNVLNITDLLTTIRLY